MSLDVEVLITFAGATALVVSRSVSGTTSKPPREGKRLSSKARPEGYEGAGPDEVEFYEVYE